MINISDTISIFGFDKSDWMDLIVDKSRYADTAVPVKTGFTAEF